MGGGGEEGCSGSSRGLSNIVLPVESASIDHYAKELQDIIEGENNESHEYYKLSTQSKYHKLFYDLIKNEYNLDKLINHSANVEEASVHSNSNPPGDAEGQITPETDTEVSSNAVQSKKILI